MPTSRIQAALSKFSIFTSKFSIFTKYYSTSDTPTVPKKVDGKIFLELEISCECRSHGAVTLSNAVITPAVKPQSVVVGL